MTHTFDRSHNKEKELIKQKKHLPALHAFDRVLRDQYGCYLDWQTYVEHNSDSWQDISKQKQGIDAGCNIVSINSQQQKFITWDYKFRFKSYTDFLAETVSVDYRNTLGWAVDPNKINDYIFNINIVTNQVVFVSRKKLRDAIIDNKFSDIMEQKSRNKGYNTKFIAVPLDRLKKECLNTVVLRY
jgi:hypothetical protein